MPDDESESVWHACLRDAVEEVSAALGPGLTESIYQHALAAELRARGFVVEVEKIFEIKYKNQSVGFLRADLVVDGRAVLELKTVAKITDAHIAQLDAYMRQMANRICTGAVINIDVRGGVEIKTLETAIDWGVPSVTESLVKD
jgi:GxxExxY protein